MLLWHPEETTHPPYVTLRNKKIPELLPYNELLFGCLDEEVEALQQYKAQYDEARRLSDGSDSCWSHSGSDSDSEAVPEVDIEPLPMGGAGEGASQRGKVEGADCEQTG